MRKLLLILFAILAAVTIAAMPLLCAHSNILPEVSTAYYEQKAQQEALTATGPEAELMRMLMGLSADATAEPVSTPLTFSPFGLLLALGAVIGAALPLWMSRKLPALRSALCWACVLAVPLGFIGARLVYCLVNIVFYVKDIAAPEAMLKVWEGGLSLSGALVFSVLAGVVGAKLGKASAGLVLYTLVPGLFALVIASAFAAKSVSMGYGPEMAESFFTVSIHATPRLDTAFLQVVTLGAAFLIAARCMPRSLAAGSRFALYTFLYGTVMILLESLRKDGHMVWGFVHAEMVFDLVFALAGLLYLARTKARLLLSLLFTAVMAGAVVALEFALDRAAIGDGLLYAAYIAVLGGYLAWGIACTKKQTAV